MKTIDMLCIYFLELVYAYKHDLTLNKAGQHLRPCSLNGSILLDAQLFILISLYYTMDRSEVKEGQVQLHNSRVKGSNIIEMLVN